MGFHTVEQIVGQRACADESLIEILLNAGAGEQPIQQFLGQMFFGDVCHCPCSLSLCCGCCAAPSYAVARFPAYRTPTFRKHAEKFSCQLMYGPRVSPTMVDAIRVGAVAERMFMRGIKHRQ